VTNRSPEKSERRDLRLAIVVHRYGLDINGGSELHARYLAERLAAHASVRVLTTCARDHVSWRNDLPAGEERVNGVPVERFAVSRERDLIEFSRRSAQCFDETHSIQDELRWLESEGPACRALVRRLRRAAAEFDFVILFSIRYYDAYYGARTVPRLAVLVPTAEREAALGLQIFPPIFRGVRAIMYNSWEEQALVNALSSNHSVPGVVVGIGSDVPGDPQPERARRAFGLRDPFIVYVGRIEENKGCRELFDYFGQYLARTERPLDLVLVGNAGVAIPPHPRIRHLGFLSDADKFDVMAAARLLVMPSPFESLSMAALEAWAIGRPVLANARCDVLVGQCVRSNAGLFYRDAVEFGAALDMLLDQSGVAETLGMRGRAYFAEQYSWPVIERKYLAMFAQLADSSPAHVMEPLPGWFARRARRQPPGAEVIARLPAGPALPS
jgi:glycosyltransferase involved in cell wall biosynthesis